MTTDNLGTVASIQYGKFLIDFQGELLTLEVGRNLPYKMQKELVVGDIVEMKRKGDEWRIVNKRKRRNALTRLKGKLRRPRKQVIAANIDLAVIVAAKRNPKFHPGLIDRYLILCRYGGIDPMICINKADLEGDVEDLDQLSWYRDRLGIPVVLTSAHAAQGLDALKAVIHGKTAVLVGNSGVGKTSLVNAVLPQLDLKVADVDRFGDGRHTTTYSGLYEWEPGSYLIDTPGIRSLEVSLIPKDTLPIGFPEFQEYLGGCAFSNCTHDHEPQCGVFDAVERGEISASRYESYLSILASYEQD
ncbi:MAG: ribosome small subunit-dependent GTPase A [Acidobacteriota bacterium]|nr:ribosome small subunit-dependent GTPase A [Acidobacteriota bacterium]